MADRPIAKLYKAIKTAEEGKLFKSFGRAERLKGEYPTGTLRKRAAARAASMDVRAAKTLRGEQSQEARGARIRQKATIKGVTVTLPQAEALATRPQAIARGPHGASAGIEELRQAEFNLSKLGKLAKKIELAKKIGRIGGRVGGKLGMLSLPSQYLEYKEMMRTAPEDLIKGRRTRRGQEA